MLNKLLIGLLLYRRKRVDSNAETGQEGTPSRPPPSSWSAGKKQGKDFHLKKRTGKGNPHAARRHKSRDSGGKGDRTNFKPKSKWQPGNSQGNRGDKSPGSNQKRIRDGASSKIQNSEARAPGHSPSFKKRKRSTA